MQINIITLFDQLLAEFVNSSLIKKAQQKKLVKINILNLREFGLGSRKNVDAKPFGGGAGMLMRVEPIVHCLESIAEIEKKPVILLCPSGELFDQNSARALAKLDFMTLICGRYEGFDKRVEQFSDQKISIGSFVLMGGEVAAMAIIEAVIRLVPGVLGNELSTIDESFNGYLEYPQYTKPINFRGHEVPELLRSGNHEQIKRWKQLNKFEIKNGN